MKHFRRVGRTDGIDHTLESNDIDVILCPADSDIDEVVSAAGYPAAVMPLGTYKGNGRPFGVVAVAGQYREDLLIKVMGAWEATFGPRAMPSLDWVKR